MIIANCAGASEATLTLASDKFAERAAFYGLTGEDVIAAANEIAEEVRSGDRYHRNKIANAIMGDCCQYAIASAFADWHRVPEAIVFDIAPEEGDLAGGILVVEEAIKNYHPQKNRLLSIGETSDGKKTIWLVSKSRSFPPKKIIGGLEDTEAKIILEHFAKCKMKKYQTTTEI